MKERERVVVTGVGAVLLLAWLGFLVHRTPRFSGSGTGAAFGIAAAVLMLIPLAYPIAKRIGFLRERISRRVSLQSLLAVHVYAGILGPLLAIIHTGHNFKSVLGITLTAVMLLAVATGFAVRYLLTYVGQEMKDKLVLLQTARGDLDSAWGVLERATPGARARPKTPIGPAGEITRIAESVADLEYAVRTHEFFKRLFGLSLKVHIALSVALYLLLALHVGAEIYFGLRWLR